MKIVIGLGNPGDKYHNTKHNVGFWAIDVLSARLSTPCTQQKWKSLVGECRIGVEKVILCKPQTFMNLSGEALREVIRFYSGIEPETDVILLYDDMDFPPGTVKLREKGSAGGHNGVKSIMAHLGTEVFPRVRMGIGRPEPGRPVIQHVLSPFPAEQQKLVEQAAQRAAEAVHFALEHSFTLAMNRFNE
ncbi:aminoacyl-tRNA hydrolase [Alicyclobacillus tolerans]|uniref:aminoacyl-tRNA hydrolase n=1 Tax=Alicyclobacillus tolerans TaxID=90970 RepID=UPI001F016143|nr:aminoacyl-tRNA hydrolase [Alicyclobacillus tolerans]MCF8566301.1 aminoacyl-tRNA hydrolase [Alicyclobacillus tolerans]